MKKYNRILCIMLALLITLCAAGCGLTETGEGTGTEEKQPRTAVIYDGNTAKYKIIRSEDAEQEVVEAASGLWESLYKSTGSSSVSILSDWTADGGAVVNDAFEILIGMTNRPESGSAAGALPKYLDFSVSFIGNKICIYASTPERTAEAVGYFISSLKTDGNGVISYTAPEVYVDSPEYPLGNLTLGGLGIMGCRIVIPSSDGAEAELKLAEKLAVYLAENTGIKPEIIQDSEHPAEGCEISIGMTDRVGTVVPPDSGEYTIGVTGSVLWVLSGAASGYAEAFRTVAEQYLSLGSLTDRQGEKYTMSGISGARVMFIGNSFTYYGRCVVNTASKQPVNAGSYFELVAADYGDDVTVTNFTYGGANLSDGTAAVTSAYAGNGLYERLLSAHPDYYGNPAGKPMDSIYNQDYVILQQSGSNQSNTYSASKKIQALFPPETKFCFYVTTYDVSKNFSSNLNAAKTLRDKDGYTHIPVGYMVYELWTKGVSGSVLTYNKNSFIVNQSSKDGYHPNYLTGYITALTVYCALTGKSAVGAGYGFVNTEMTYYTNGTSNFDKILASAPDMEEIQRRIDRYITEYN